MRKTRNPHMERFAQAVALMVKRSRTADELRDALGTCQMDQAYDYIHAMRGEGLLYICGWRKTANGGRAAAIYAFQPSVCEMPDEEYPYVVRVRRKVVRDRVTQDNRRAPSPAEAVQQMQQAANDLCASAYPNYSVARRSEPRANGEDWPRDER